MAWLTFRVKFDLNMTEIHNKPKEKKIPKWKEREENIEDLRSYLNHTSYLLIAIDPKYDLMGGLSNWSRVVAFK
jgi:hypothetical protein